MAVAPLRIYFAARAIKLDDRGKRAVRQLVAHLGSEPRRFLVVGNADTEGSRDGLLSVSRHRAEQVAEALEKAGVQRRKIQIDAAGDSRPIATNTTGQGRAVNRRVDVFVLP